MSENAVVVEQFISELSSRAKYGIKGEKPLALIASLKYVHENHFTGLNLLDLLQTPHITHLKNLFIDLANKYAYGSISNPKNSWSTITGSNRELQNAVARCRSGDVDFAFSKLTSEEIDTILSKNLRCLTGTNSLMAPNPKIIPEMIHVKLEESIGFGTCIAINLAISLTGINEPVELSSDMVFLDGQPIASFSGANTAICKFGSSRLYPKQQSGLTIMLNRGQLWNPGKRVEVKVQIGGTSQCHSVFLPKPNQILTV